MIKKLCLFSLFCSLIFLFSCQKKVDVAIQSSHENGENSFDEQAKQLLASSARAITIDYVANNEEPLILASYSPNAKNQIEILAGAVKVWTPLIFNTYQEVNTFSIFITKGEENQQYRHYCIIDRENLTAITQAQSYLEIYNALSQYYIGPLVTGQLQFVLDGVIVDLAVQKPIF